MGLITDFLGKFKIDLILLLIIAALCGAIVLSIQHSEKLSAQLASVQQEKAEVAASLSAVQAEQKASTARTQELLSTLDQIRADAQKKKDVVQKHDLDKIAKSHPSLLENKINKATHDQILRLENLTK
jgi:uncharacterized protein YoxC